MTRTRDNHFYTMRFSYSPIKHFNIYILCYRKFSKDVPIIYRIWDDSIPIKYRFCTDYILIMYQHCAGVMYQACADYDLNTGCPMKHDSW